MFNSVAWRGPVPEGFKVKPRDIFPLAIVDGEPLQNAVTGEWYRERTPFKTWELVPERRPAESVPIMSNEQIAEMVLRSYAADVPDTGTANGPSGNGGAKVPLPKPPRPITPRSGEAKPLPKILSPK